MNMIRNFILAAASVAMIGLAAVPQPAQANTILLCAPGAANPSAKRVVNPGTSGGTYQLDARGCAPFSTSNSDAAFFQSQGYVQPSGIRSAVFVTGVLTGTTAVQITPNLPASAYIRDIFVQNTTANAVTGGVDIGTTSGGADVVSALTCGASCLTFVADAALLKRVFSTSAVQSLFVVGHTAGNSANLTITITYGFF